MTKFFRKAAATTAAGTIGAAYVYIFKKCMEDQYKNIAEWRSHGEIPPIKSIPGGFVYTPPYASAHVDAPNKCS